MRCGGNALVIVYTAFFLSVGLDGALGVSLISFSWLRIFSMFAPMLTVWWWLLLRSLARAAEAAVAAAHIHVLEPPAGCCLRPTSVLPVHLLIFLKFCAQLAQPVEVELLGTTIQIALLPNSTTAYFLKSLERGGVCLRIHRFK